MGIGSADPPLSLCDISPPRSGGRGEGGFGTASARRVGGAQSCTAAQWRFGSLLGAVVGVDDFSCD